MGQINTGFIVIDNTTTEYPTSSEGRALADGKSVTPSASVFDDGAGGALAGSYIQPTRILASTFAATTAQMFLQDHAGTAYPGVSLRWAIATAGGNGLTWSHATSDPLPSSLVFRNGLSVRTAAAGLTGVLGYRYYIQ